MLLKNKNFKSKNRRNFLSPKKNPRHLCCSLVTRVFFWEQEKISRRIFSAQKLKTENKIFVSKNQNKPHTLVGGKNPQGFLINKKGLSEIVGYVLLILFVIIISVGVYLWLKSYVPEEELKCPEETSILIKELSCVNLPIPDRETVKEIKIILKNSGKFNIDGYFIRVTESEEQKIGTKDLSNYFNKVLSELAGVGNSATQHGGSLRFYNALESNDEKTAIFQVPYSFANPYSIEIIPFRFQEFKNKNRFVTCGEAKVLQKLECS